MPDTMVDAAFENVDPTVAFASREEFIRMLAAFCTKYKPNVLRTCRGMSGKDGKTIRMHEVSLRENVFRFGDSHITVHVFSITVFYVETKYESTPFPFENVAHPPLIIALHTFICCFPKESLL